MKVTKRQFIDTDEDIIDVRNLIEYAEQLEQDVAAELGIEDIAELDEADLGALTSDSLIAAAEQMRDVLSELRGNGGDEQWRGDWYPVTLIRDSYFNAYAQERADDIGAIHSEYGWPHSCIDWDQATRELQMDYTSIDINGVTYWYR